MTVDLLTTSLIESSASVIKKVYPALQKWGSKEHKDEFDIRIGDKTIKDIDIFPEGLSEDRLSEIQWLMLQAKLIDDDKFELKQEPLSKKIYLDEEELSLQRDIGAIALSISSESVFRSARRRIDLVFRINLALAITLAVILIGGIAGAIVSALVFGNSSWAIVFGGVSVADIIGVLAFKPLKEINRALIATQRLDILHLSLQKRLELCDQHKTLEGRFRCQTEVWEAIQAELASQAQI